MDPRLQHILDIHSSFVMPKNIMPGSARNGSGIGGCGGEQFFVVDGSKNFKAAKYPLFIIIIIYFHNSNLTNYYCRPQTIWITWAMCLMACTSSVNFLQNFTSFLQNFISFLKPELDYPADNYL